MIDKQSKEYKEYHREYARQYRASGRGKEANDRYYKRNAEKVKKRVSQNYYAKKFADTTDNL